MFCYDGGEVDGMSEGFIAMILLSYVLIGVVTHFMLSRRCYRLTGKMPKEIKLSNFTDWVLSGDDAVMAGVIWPVIPFVILVQKNLPFTYYNKLIRMGLEDEEVEEEEEDLSRGAYR